MIEATKLVRQIILLHLQCIDLRRRLKLGPLQSTYRLNLPFRIVSNHSHSPTGLCPYLRKTSLNASAINSCRLIPFFRAHICIASDISGEK